MKVALKPLAPEEAIKYLRGKGFKISFAWEDVWAEAHAQAFTVAKAMEMDLLADIWRAVDKALEEGQTLKQFRDELEPKLRARGWWGKKSVVDPLTGEKKEVWLGTPWRLETIFRTNIQTSYQAGRYKRYKTIAKTRPYWRYLAVLDKRTRPMHRAWHGLVLRHDDPWWDTHYPPNGWNCRCTVQTLSQRQVERLGLEVKKGKDLDELWGTDEWINPRTGEVMQVPKGIDPGWDYNPGKADPNKKAKKLLQEKLAALPEGMRAEIKKGLKKDGAD